MKRIILFSVVLSVFGFIAKAQDKFKVKNAEGCAIKYKVIDSQGKKVAVTKAKGNKKVDLVIPDIVSFNGTDYTVEAIAKKACYKVKSRNVILPNTIKYIGYAAFSYSSKLRSIYLPEGLEVIDDLSFINTPKLNSINIPSSVQYIGKFAFATFDMGTDSKQCTIENLPPIITSDNCEFCGLATNSVLSYYLKNPNNLKEKIYYKSLSQYIPDAKELEKREKNEKFYRAFGAVFSAGLLMLNEYFKSTGKAPTSVGGMNNTLYNSHSSSSLQELSVTKKIKCHKCQGTGKCAVCEGSGERTHHYKKNGEWHNTIECNYCEGSGLCRTCDGSRWITTEDLSSESYSSSSYKTTSSKTYRTCSWCNGKGRILTEKEVLHFGLKREPNGKCSECGAQMYKGDVHKHSKCSHCNGTGKLEN